MKRLLLCILVIGCGGGGKGGGPTVCGDGLVEGDEDCDDGNQTPGDGCSATCTAELCGDGVLDLGEECDDANTIDGDGCSAACRVEGSGLATVTWAFKDLATNTMTGCPVGFDTAALRTQPIDGNGQPVGQQIIDLFNCADMTGTIELSPGLVELVVGIEDTTGTSTYASSLRALLTIGSAPETASVVILNDGGYFQLAWTLHGAQSSAVLACGQVPGLTAIEITSTSGNSAVSDQFDCNDHVGITAGILAGTYITSVAALDAQNQALGTPQNQANRVIEAPNRLTMLGGFDLPIDGL